MRKSKCGTRRTILRGKKINVNQILLFKLWYIGQIYTISNASKRKFKKYMIWSGTGKKNATLQAFSSTLHLDWWAMYFRVSIKFSKNKMDSKVINSHQYSLETSHALLIALNSNQSLAKKRFLGLTDTRNYKNKTKISLFNSLC